MFYNCGWRSQTPVNECNIGSIVVILGNTVAANGMAVLKVHGLEWSAARFHFGSLSTSIRLFGSPRRSIPWSYEGEYNQILDNEYDDMISQEMILR